MKYILKTILILAALIGANINAASVPPAPVPSAPLPSIIPMKRDQLISHNLSKVARVSAQAYASSILYSSTTNTGFTVDYIPSGQPKSSDILALLGSQPLVYNLAKPAEDNVILWGFLYDTNWNQLFSGGTSFKLEPNGNGGWKAPQGAEQIQFEPVGERYTVSGLYNAYFIERDENGNPVNWTYLDIYNEGFQFPEYLRDKRGELYLSVSSGTFAYDSATGEQIVPTTVTSIASGKFNGVQSVAPIGDLITPTPVKSYQGIGESDLVEVTIITSGWYKVYQPTTEGELPDTVTVWRVGDANETEYDRVGSAQHVPVYMTPGVHHLRFIWPNLRSPNQGGGSGGGGGGGKG